jgi:hypothetical protein
MNFKFMHDSVRGWIKCGCSGISLRICPTMSVMTGSIQWPIERLAESTNNGGGAFAVGNHWNWRVSMCSLIPRVRSACAIDETLAVALWLARDHRSLFYQHGLVSASSERVSTRE